MKKTIEYFFIYVLLIFLTNSFCLVEKPIKEKKIHSKVNSIDFPKSNGFVNDFEQILSKEQEIELTKMLKQHEALTTDQIVLVTLNSYAPYTSLFDYSLDLANYWGIGQKDKNNGILIAVGKECRSICIQTGYGLEKRLPDHKVKKIIDEIMIPEFKLNNYFEGIKKGVAAITLELKHN